MDNSEKKYGSLGCILASAMLSALINKDFSTNDAEPDESNEKPAKDVHDCNGNCKNKCKSCKESNTELDMDKVTDAYLILKSQLLADACALTNKREMYLHTTTNLKSLGEALGVEKG